MKMCTKCGKRKSLKSFHTYRKYGKIWKQSYCKMCSVEATRRWKFKNPGRILFPARKSRLKRTGGLTIESRDQILRKQKHRCAACGEKKSKKFKWVADHNHKCCKSAKFCNKCFRGFLCPRCNLALGMVKDSVRILLKLMRYLKGR
jgi:hypothetical protein